ncbi:MAG TPA: hypothetical protein VES67_09935 [Vicinamibacterales bacterium]|nr:hypothetical protein [Vicinamibacterales bacterium]
MDVGRPDPAAIARAVSLIDSGATLPRWREAGKTEAAKHAAALAKVRAELLQAPPAPRVARAMPKNPFALGDFVEVRLPSGKLAAIRIVSARIGKSAGDISLVVMTAYAFRGDRWPGREGLEALGLLKNSELTWYDDAARPPLVWMVAGGRAPRTIYNVRDHGGDVMTGEAVENAGVSLWRHVPARLEAVLLSQGL